MISIAMTYFNRLNQLDYTLNTLRKSKIKKFEVVIVDDFSHAEHDPVQLLTSFGDLNIKIIHMRDHESQKWWRNPCVPFNVAIAACQGQKIVLQNPECCHMGDVLSAVDQHCGPGQYVSFHAWATSKEDTVYLHNHGRLPEQSLAKKKSRWYNHQTVNPTAFHFCAAIDRQDLIMLNGFDEKFALGHSYDDAEFLFRVKQICKIHWMADPYVVHQHHPKFFGRLDNPELAANNRLLYENLVANPEVRANDRNILS